MNVSSSQGAVSWLPLALLLEGCLSLLPSLVQQLRVALMAVEVSPFCAEAGINCVDLGRWLSHRLQNE